jgi:hypothetical protein
MDGPLPLIICSVHSGTCSQRDGTELKNYEHPSDAGQFSLAGHHHHQVRHKPRTLLEDLLLLALN